MKSFNGWKYCPGCKCIYPVKLFYRQKSNQDRLHHYCKECVSEQAKRKYYESISSGLCAMSGCKKPIDTPLSHSLCRSHRLQINESGRRIREDRRKNKKCLQCGKPLDRVGTRCTDCCDIRNNHNHQK